jgi:pilus assembly protein FimV
MAYNKNKHIEAAQKLFSQGKLAPAISEYQQILKHEPTDPIILMTVGDLFVRKGETFQAIEYFERLAQVFTRDGFLSKAIAIYKKIAKLAPEETKPLEKLAELYVQQGILSEARPIFLQLAEAHLKADRREPAAALLRKLLEAEPDNMRVQMRLAEIQHAMGNSADAAQTYLNCAERQVANLQPGEALKLVERALELAPEALQARLIQAHALALAGRGEEAAELLESVPDAESKDEVVSPLLELYLDQNRGPDAVALAQRIFVRDATRYKHAEHAARELLKCDEPAPALGLLQLIRGTMAGNGAHETLVALLQAAAQRMPERLEPYEWLVELYTQLEDSVHLPGALAQLGQAGAAAGNLKRAREVYERLLALVPTDDTVRKNLDHIRTQLSLPPSEIPRPEPPRELAAEEEPASSPAFAEIPLDEETQKYVTLSLTDVDLFSSYGLMQKAIDLLEDVIARAPRHTGALEKLLDLYLGAGNSPRTVELAATLASIHQARGDSAQAEHFQELARRFQRATPDRATTPAVQEAGTPAPSAPAEFDLPEPAPASEEEIAALATEQIATLEAVPSPSETEAVEVEAVVAISEGSKHDGEIREVDLSEEWAQLSAPPGSRAEDAPEIQMPSVLQAPPVEQPVAAETHEEDLAQPTPEEMQPELVEARTDSELASEMDLLLQALRVSGMAEEAPDQAAPGHGALGTPMTMPGPSVIEMPATNSDAREEPAPVEALDYELELVESQARFGAKPLGRSLAPGTGDLAAELQAALQPEAGTPFLGPADPLEREDAVLAAAAHQRLRGASDPGGPLCEIFKDFREQLDELETDEDPETHYNLGIAYREMGLLEEAISEFQKVAQAHDGGKAFKYAMQCCTLLGLSFMEKGQPEIAAFWYGRALRTPGLDAESVLALRYDLGLAQELGGQAGEALRNFQQVYAMNIDYRDVGERIAALRRH